MSKRDLASIQLAFYGGARGVLKVHTYLIERGDYEELHETIKRHGRQSRGFDRGARASQKPLTRRPRKPPAFVTPMAALAVKKLPEGNEWLYELKWVGYRALLIKDGEDLQIRSRND